MKFKNNTRILKYIAIAFSLFLFFTLVGIFSSLVSYYMNIAKGVEPIIILFNLSFWWLWLFMLPVVILIDKVVGIHKKNIFLYLSVHFLVNIILVFIHEWVISYLGNTILGSTYYLLMSDKLLYRVTHYQYKILYRLTHYQWPYVGFIIYWMFLAGYYAYAYYKRFRERELKCALLNQQLSESKLRALKMQVHPHFLFNSFNALSTMIKKGENQKAQNMINRFSDFLRMTLKEEGYQFIPLKQELSFIQCYLEIEKIRFQDKLNMQFNIAQDSLSGYVPNLILQPLVENSIRHAITTGEKTGNIAIHTKQDKGKLFIRIEDNGPGLPSDFQLNDGNGIGLQNVNERLNSLYGNQAEFHLLSLPTGGLLVDIVIPFCNNYPDQKIFQV